MDRTDSKIDTPVTHGSSRSDLTPHRAARMQWALQLICRTGKCENSTAGIGDCLRDGRTPDAEYGADRWCKNCLAYFALHGGFQ